MNNFLNKWGNRIIILFLLGIICYTLIVESWDQIARIFLLSAFSFGAGALIGYMEERHYE